MNLPSAYLPPVSLLSWLDRVGQRTPDAITDKIREWRQQWNEEQPQHTTLSGALSYCAPPIELLTLLDRTIATQGDKVPVEIQEWREQWRKVNAGEALPELDELDKPYQLQLLHELSRGY